MRACRVGGATVAGIRFKKGNAVSGPECEEERGRKTKGKRKGGGEEELRKDEEIESKPSTALDVLNDQKK